MKSKEFEMSQGDQHSGPQDIREQFAGFKQRIQSLGEAVTSAEATGVSADGLVTVRASASRGLFDLSIEPAALESGDNKALAESVLDAVQDASRLLRQANESKFAAMSEMVERLQSIQKR